VPDEAPMTPVVYVVGFKSSVVVCWQHLWVVWAPVVRAICMQLQFAVQPDVWVGDTWPSQLPSANHLCQLQNSDTSVNPAQHLSPSKLLHTVAMAKFCPHPSCEPRCCGQAWRWVVCGAMCSTRLWPHAWLPHTPTRSVDGIRQSSCARTLLSARQVCAWVGGGGAWG
jgi:hypothetical protein